MRARARVVATTGSMLALAAAGTSLLLATAAAGAQDGDGICDGLCGTACHEMLTGEGHGRRRGVPERLVSRVAIARLFVRGSITARRVRGQILRRFGLLRACGTESGGRGRITLRLVVTTAGAVQEVEQVASTLGNGVTEQCVASVLRAVTFPASGESGPTEVRLTLAVR